MEVSQVCENDNSIKTSVTMLQPVWNYIIDSLGEDATQHPLFFTISVMITVGVCGLVFSFVDVFITHRVSMSTTLLYALLTMPAYSLAYLVVWKPVSYRLPLVTEAPTLAELVGGVIFCLVVGDISSYWWHRLEHASQFIWNHVHYFHHSYEHELSVWSGLYVHPVESFVVFCAFYYYPFLSTMMDPKIQGIFWVHPLTFSVYAIFNTFITMVTHCGYDLPFYPSFFASYPMHNHHHTKRLQKSTSGDGRSTRNFCVLLTLSDKLFGTFLDD